MGSVCLIFETADGTLRERMLFRADEAKLSLAEHRPRLEPVAVQGRRAGGVAAMRVRPHKEKRLHAGGVWPKR